MNFFEDAVPPHEGGAGLCASVHSSCLLKDAVTDCESEYTQCGSFYTIIIFPLLALCSGLILQPLEIFLRLPYTLLLLGFGAILGALGCGVDLSLLSVSLRQWIHLEPPEVFFYIFLAPLIFESSFNADYFIFKKLLFQIVLLAFLMVFMQIAAVGVFQVYAINSPNWDWWAALMFGSMLSATDPISVTATLKSLGASELMGTLIEGESLLNDGSAFVLWEAFFENVKDNDISKSIGEIVVDIIRLSLGGVAMGMAFGLVAVIFLAFIYESFEVEVSLTVIVAFLGFWTAQSPSKLSGVICNVVSGLILSRYGRALISPSVKDPLAHLWELLAWAANTVVFVYAGVLLVSFIWVCSGEPLTSADYWYILAYYAFLQAIRFLFLFILFPILKVGGQKWLTWRELTIVALAGLRGSVSLILALEVGHNEWVNDDVKTRVVVWTCGIVALTLIVNGIIVKPCMHWLKLDVMEPVKEEFLLRAKGMMLDRTFQTLDSISVDGSFKNARWSHVLKTVIPAEWVQNAEVAQNALVRASLETASIDFATSLDLNRKLSVPVNASASMEYVRRSVSYNPQAAPVTTRGANSGNYKPVVTSTEDSNPEERYTRMSGAFTDALRKHSHSMWSNRIGEELDVEVRRRFLMKLLEYLRSAYEVDIVEFNSVQALTEDVKAALQANEAGEPYALLTFIDPNYSRNKLHGIYKNFQRKLRYIPFFENVAIHSRLTMLSAVVPALVEVMKEPFMDESELVFQEAEKLYELSLIYMNRIEATKKKFVTYNQTNSAIRLTFKAQGDALSNLKKGGYIDDEEFRLLKDNLTDVERTYYTWGYNASSYAEALPSETVARESGYLNQLSNTAYDQARNQFGQIVKMSDTQNSHMTLEKGSLLIVLKGAVKIDQGSEAAYLAEDGDKDDENARRRSSLHLHGNIQTTLHWCFPVYHGLISAYILEGKTYGDAILDVPYVYVCDVLGYAEVLVVNPEGVKFLLDADEIFHLQAMRTIARQIVIESITEEPPHALSYCSRALALDEPSLNSRTGIALHLLRGLPYSKLLTVAVDEKLEIKGPAILLRGKIRILNEDLMAEVDKDVDTDKEGYLYTGPKVLTGESMMISVMNDQESSINTALLLIHATQGVEDYASERISRWRPTSIVPDANGMYGIHRHINARHT